MVNAESGINKWLTLGENVVYDSKSNNITVDNERYYRAVVTSKRAMFLQADKVHEVTNNLVASLSWQRIVHWGLLALGMILVAISIVVNLYLTTNNLAPMTGFEKIFSYVLAAGGVVSIIVFVFHRPEKLQIYSAGRPLMIGGSRRELQEIMTQIRNQQALHEQEKQRTIGDDMPQSVEELIRQLKLRLAKGEITEEEYMRLKKTIES